ncbi:hypothetical protein [Mucilaginibacter paludis]|uniref:DUF4105 domain-containing protein n=1 Tax=Mucilaginibacter paludis DSM 18603 TaxID=714943 RepID=H1Y734_9SPHI|nr:hypothetical protein [Mucilaginibacter paludis]EHQ28653.1 hypothetical protein Mucpa_4564 [Mucilaginibacter paludis DSM 18603]
MFHRIQPLLGAAMICATLFLYSSPAQSQSLASVRVRSLLKDSSLNHLNSDLAFGQGYKVTPSASTGISAEVNDYKLLDNLNENISKPQQRKQLLAYLKSLKVEHTASTAQAKTKFYYSLANTFARLRLYPLAMKCFLKTIPKTRKEPASQRETSGEETAYADTDLTDTAAEQYLSINSKDDSLISEKAPAIEKSNAPVKSKAITYQHIHQTFDDGKEAVAYAMLFHVKQPLRGKRKIFVLNNVGHTFITLIKYNSDSTYTSVSFGFYPKKNNILSATPLIPSAPSVFKDDSGHEWDEVLGKFISKRKFEKIQGLILNYNGVKYNLSKNNCTDFGIKAAELAGISIQETYGTWPLGKGNNPAITGQSILEGKFNTTEADGKKGLFVDSISSVPIKRD